MPESNQDEYRTLSWIINQSEQGMFLVIADENVQRDMVDFYRRRTVEVYDYKKHPGAYSFRDLEEWVVQFPETQTFMVANFHLAIQDEESIRRLNFSRDMLEGLGKNMIFLVTPYGDDRLAVGAYDFYSFVKLRIIFRSYDMQEVSAGEMPSAKEEPSAECEWEPEEARRKMAEANDLIERAVIEEENLHYLESGKLLLAARDIKEKLLGPEHLEIAELENALAGVYESEGQNRVAEELYKKSLRIGEQVLGENHPDTAKSYNNLAGVYEKQGKQKEALLNYLKAYRIFNLSLGIDHPHTKIVYKNLKSAYYDLDAESDFDFWLKEQMKA